MTKLQSDVAELNRLKTETEKAVSLLNQIKTIQDSMISLAQVRDQLNKLLSRLPGDARNQINTCTECKKYFLSYGKLKSCIDCSSAKIEESEPLK